jgi:hypothetical protein
MLGWKAWEFKLQQCKTGESKIKAKMFSTNNISFVFTDLQHTISYYNKIPKHSLHVAVFIFAKK